ncbi:MAG: hypothetical protein JWN76_1160 [Chitinophagaceae bacterium]|nr:hypothetical protein [Chitinophagaceae bacterium]
MPILTLTTDIGQDDYITGAIKGQILSLQPAFNIVDISHNLSPFNYPQAAYLCSNSFRYFPKDTYHLILVNLFSNSSPHILIARHNNQYIACPDNGLLTMIIGQKPAELVSIPVDLRDSATTLDYTHAIAYAFGNISKGQLLENIGTQLDYLVESYPLRCTIGPDWMEGQIIFIDRFENVIVNITRDEFEEHRKGRSFKIVFTRNEIINKLSANYADVPDGEKLAWFNSAGFLEIAVNKGNMAGLFGLQGFNETMNAQSSSMQNNWFYQTVRIFFE